MNFLPVTKLSKSALKCLKYKLKKNFVIKSFFKKFLKCLKKKYSMHITQNNIGHIKIRIRSESLKTS